MRTKSAYPSMGMALTALAFCTQPGFADQYSDGNTAYSAGNYPVAKSHFLKATQVKPKQWEAHYQLANTYVQLKDSANAKASYKKCISLHPPADVVGNCTNALAVIERNPTLAPPKAKPAPWHVQMIRPKDSTLAEPPADTAGSGKGDTAKEGDKKSAEAKEAENVKPEVAKQRAQIMKQADEEVEKMKAQEQRNHDDANANSNQRNVQPDGTIKYGMTADEEARYKKDVEDKANAIRDKAKKKAADIK